MAGTQREGQSDEARLEEQPDAGALRAPDSAPGVASSFPSCTWPGPGAALSSVWSVLITYHFSTVILQRVLVSGLSISLSSFLFFPQSSLCAFFFFHVNSRMSLSICFQEHLEF